MMGTTSQGPGLAGTIKERHEKMMRPARADFRFGGVNAALLIVFFLIGLVIHLAVYGQSDQAVWTALGSALILVALFASPCFTFLMLRVANYRFLAPGRSSVAANIP